MKRLTKKTHSLLLFTNNVLCAIHYKCYNQFITDSYTYIHITRKYSQMHLEVSKFTILDTYLN